MSGIPLIETKDPALIARGYNLGLKIVPNLLHVLGVEDLEYYEANLPELKEALAKGLRRQSKPAPPIVASPTPQMFKTLDTDLLHWFSRAEVFAKKCWGVEVRLAEIFQIPQELPWKSAIPVFDPGGITNRQAVEKALKAQKLSVWEEEDVMKYSGYKAGDTPSLFLIQNSICPDEDTLDLSPDQLVETGKRWLSQRGYMFAFGLHHSVTGEYLDPQTWTWFPANRLPSGGVACGCWFPDFRGVRFSWGYADGHFPSMGARLAMPLSLKS